MPWDQEHGCNEPGTIGRATHIGDPLTVDQITQLPDQAEVVITWSGGNGPWPYRITVDAEGARCADTTDRAPLLTFGPEQRVPLHRVTNRWDDQARQWYEAKPHLR